MLACLFAETAPWKFHTQQMTHAPQMRDVLDFVLSVARKTLVVERHLRHRDHDVGLVAVRAEAFDRSHGLVALEPPTAIGRAVGLGELSPWKTRQSFSRKQRASWPNRPGTVVGSGSRRSRQLSSVLHRPPCAGMRARPMLIFRSRASAPWRGSRPAARDGRKSASAH